MEGLYNEHANLTGAGGGIGTPVVLGAASHGGLGFGGGSSDFLSLIIGLKALESFGHNHGHGFGGFGIPSPAAFALPFPLPFPHGHGHGHCKDNCVTLDTLNLQTLAQIRADIGSSSADIRSDVKDIRADVREAAGDVRADVKQGVADVLKELGSEFRVLDGKLCNIDKQAIIQGYEARLSALNLQNALSSKMDSEFINVGKQIREIKDDLKDKFCDLRDGQLRERIDDLRREKEALARLVQNDQIIEALAERLGRRDRDRGHRHHSACDFDIPLAAVPGTVMAPLIATAQSDPCGTSAVARTTK